MGFARITEAVEALQAAGLRAGRGYTAGKMAALTGPVAAVNVHTVSAEQTVLLVNVYDMVEGPACEDAAKTAMEALEAIGGLCTVTGCQWDGRAGVFCCPVKAVWQEHADCTVTVGNLELVYATGVTVKKHISRVQVTDPESGETKEENRDLGWSVTIVEMLPKDYMPEKERQETFTVYIQRPGGKERYEQCQWVQILLEDVPGGLRRTRMARTWENRDIVNV